MDYIERLCNILSESKMVWFLLHNMENIASSVGSIAQYRFSLSRKVVQWTSSRANNYGHESKRRREKFYFRMYRSISFFTGFVECQLNEKKWIRTFASQTYFSIDNAHLMYNAHPKLFRHSFWSIDNAHDVFFDR